MRHYLRKLERQFQLAYGNDGLKAETNETMLYNQLQEGLSFRLVKSSAVSGCQAYKELCVAAKQEEKRLADLKRRQQHQSSIKPQGKRTPNLKMQNQFDSASGSQVDTEHKRRPFRPRACFNCGSTSHLARECKVPSSESGKKGTSQHSRTDSNKLKMVQTPKPETGNDDPMTYLESSDSDEGSKVAVVRVPFQGSHPRQALVNVHGVPARGIIDTGADITILCPELFKTIAAAAHLKKKALKPVDKEAFTYDNRPILLNGARHLL